MDTRRIGSLEVSSVGLGCNNFGRRLDAAGTAEVVNAALDAGVTFFDTADSYGDGTSEERSATTPTVPSATPPSCTTRSATRST